MKPEAQRIAIAEAMGYEWYWLPVDPAGFRPRQTLCPPQWRKDGFLPAPPLTEIRVDDLNAVTDYLIDLNAMHEAETVLTPEQQWPYAQALFRVLESAGVLSSSFATLHASAAQRAEAFLRTIGKWEEAP
jgi:hypothetical protein